MAWRVARSLETLRVQLNQLAPNRSKAADGGIGDAEHASRASDHNPHYGPASDGLMLVTARDYTHDPAGGLDCHWLARQLTANLDHRIKYIIWDRRTWNPGIGWRTYTGPNAHTHHLHLSAVASPACDDPGAWNLGAATTPMEDDMEWDTVYKFGRTGYATAYGNWLGETNAAAAAAATTAARVEVKLDALAGRLSDDEANVLVEVRRASGLSATQTTTILAAIATLEAGEQADEIVARLKADLGPELAATVANLFRDRLAD